MIDKFVAVGRLRLRDYGITVGSLPTGRLNGIGDVPGVRVGHLSLSNGSVRTGVTAIVPHPGNLFQEKLEAATHVINGFGKSAGLMQVAELGSIETPIILTNTLSVGAATTGLVRFMLAANPDIGVDTGTVNPLVFECNDGYLNDIRGLHVKEEHVAMAIASATETVAEGSVGAGTGMSCYGLKGGIGSASRRLSLDGRDRHLGVLVLTNMGPLADLVVDGRPVGRDIAKLIAEHGGAAGDQGSIIVIIATDAPLDARQLGRLCRRAEVGIARTGNMLSGGSGEIALAFSTARRIPHYPPADSMDRRVIHEDTLDLLFRALIEGVEEAILNAMLASSACIGRDGHKRESLAAFMASAKA
jgi:D-aminopeptidase